jgi:TRAP-type mannitol/chloroaromatic compound transport system substrate-binding protein
MNRRKFLVLSGALATTSVSAATPGKTEFEWKMVTSWPKNSPGPGLTAERLAERITAMSGGRLTVKVYGAGELVPALEVFDAVSRGTAELGHTAALFWRGKVPAGVFFTAVPFGLTADEHAAWVYHGGGQALWDELYADFGLQALMAGNTGMGMGGWFKREINSLDDVRGLKYRIPGLGGDVLQRLGATPIVLPAGEIFAALQAGLVDGAEWVGPWSDTALGLYKAAPYYYWPGFHEPNGTGECLINRQSFAKLPADLQAIVNNACAVESSYSLAEAEWHNAESLERLVREHGVQVRAFPEDVVGAARAAATEVLAEFGKGDALSRRIFTAYEAARQRAMGWSRVSILAFLKARGA